MTADTVPDIATEPDWQRLNHAPESDPDSVDLWLVALETSANARDQSTTDRSLAGLALRRILSHYTGLDPDAVDIARRPGGKPYLSQHPHPPFFNLSHTRGWSLIAVTDVAEVGVDIERARSSVDIVAVTKRVFGPAAAESISRLADADKMPSFLRTWTRFEASQKAMGRGIFADPVAPDTLQISTLRISSDTVASVAVVSERLARLRFFTQK